MSGQWWIGRLCRRLGAWSIFSLSLFLCCCISSTSEWKSKLITRRSLISKRRSQSSTEILPTRAAHQSNGLATGSTGQIFKNTICTLRHLPDYYCIYWWLRVSQHFQIDFPVTEFCLLSRPPPSLTPAPCEEINTKVLIVLSSSGRNQRPVLLSDVDIYHVFTVILS